MTRPERGVGKTGTSSQQARILIEGAGRQVTRRPSYPSQRANPGAVTLQKTGSNNPY